MFKPDEKVVCINDNGAPELVLNDIYTVLCYCKDCNGTYGVILKELNPDDGYFCWRFRKLDHSFAENILNELNTEFNKQKTTI